MIKVLLFFFVIFFIKSYAQESPKNIISEENKNMLVEEEAVVEQDANLSLEEESTINTQENFNTITDATSTESEDNLIVIEDLPNKFNPWNGVLSSDNDGLGWMMWGSTSYLLSKNLIDKVNPSSYSPTLNNLLKNFLLSRAKGPDLNGKENSALLKKSSNEETLPYLEKKIAYLVHTGFNDDINILINSIPQDLKTNDFEMNNFQIRLNNFDIPYLCNNISKMLSIKERFTLHRKVLIICKLILKKEEEAMLAMDLLENDILEEDKFLNNIRSFLNDQEKEKLSIDQVINEDSNLLKMLYFYDYTSAKNTFRDMPRIFHKTIYDLKLFSKELQVESLEFLVNQGVYPASKLTEEYNFLITEEEFISFMNNNQQINKEDNTVKLRATLFKIINTSISKTERAKNLMTLWNLGSQKNIAKAIYMITKNSTLSLSPDPSLNWFNLSAFKALLLSDEIEAAKKWIFYGTSDVKERASIDINFCRLLVLLYIYDNNTKDSLNEILDINFLLKILNNDLNIDERSFLKLILTMHALDEKIPDEMWEIFLNNQPIELEKVNTFR